MKIRQQTIDRLESITRKYEGIRVARCGFEASVLRHHIFESSCRCRPDRDDPLSRGTCGIQSLCCLRGQIEALRAQAVICGIIRPYRQERADADVQGERNRCDIALFQFRENFRSEVKSGRWRCDRAGLVRKDRLILRRVRRHIPPLYIRRSGT